MFQPLEDGKATVTLATEQVVDWGALAVHAPDAWKLTKGDGVRIAVLDTGCDNTHPDLALNVMFAERDNNGHGTHVSGIIAASDNAYGVIGIAPHASLWVWQVIPTDGASLLAAFEKAHDCGCDIIHMSMGSYSEYPPLHDAIKAAYADGVVIVAAAGNDPGSVAYPAQYDEVIAVTALDEQMQRAHFAPLCNNHLALPGVNVLSTWPDNQYARLSGTSQAAPMATGIIALMLALHKPEKADVHALVMSEFTAIDRSSPDFLFTPNLDLLK